ncbi:alpha/beta hydrolase [Acinetobacter pittii]|uniref:alpha/beta hydrolase n=1 Tax=Acinetobacter pittii TaxID=48296 RepID=UPI000CE49E1D|nr:alpha/beta hydrolase [Acinetobacter pittii]PPC07724.1 alpha/beta hydrolase [Acinetobacter pittii]WPP60784.1 alpha/beta hydrolase [Acinetobacter pittii]
MRLYDNARTVANEHKILAGFQRTSLLSYQKFTHMADIQYGPNPRSTLDLFPLEQAKKTVIFIHGGYWQWCDKSDFAFIAPDVLAKGAQCVLLEYDLAPQSKISDITSQVNQAFDFIREQDWRTDEVVLVGHSAGAHLAAFFLGHPLISEMVLLSGIYDLEPIQSTHLNHALNLSREDILKYSPIHYSDRVTISCSILCGELELDELKWQSQTYFESKKGQDQNLVSFKLIPHINHYTILEHYFRYILS